MGLTMMLDNEVQQKFLEDSGYAQGWGWTLTDEDIEQMKNCDNRDVLYPALENKLIQECESEQEAAI